MEKRKLAPREAGRGLAMVVLSVSFAGPSVFGQTTGSSVEPAALQVTWTPRAPMSIPRMDLGVAVVNGKLYAVGGFSGSTLSLVEEYDPANDSWTRKTDMPTPRRLHVVAAVNGKVYAIGGASFTDPNDLHYSYATEEFDPVANAWSTKAPIPLDPPFNNVLGNVFIGGAAANGKIYVFAFNTNTPGSTATYQYDPVQDQWTTGLAPVPFGGRYAVASLNGRLYVLGTSSLGPASFAEYDPSQNIWVVLASPSANLTLQGLTATGSSVYAIGGLDGGNALGTVQVFDPTAGTWQLATPLGTPRQSAGSAFAGGKLYAVGGSTGAGVPLASVESGDPGGESASFLCASSPSLNAGTLNLHFEMATPTPATWNLWLSYGNAVGRVWSVALPAYPGFPLDLPIPNFPAVGSIGFLTTLVTSNGIVCSDWDVVDTGTPSATHAAGEVQQLFKEAVVRGR